MSKKPENMRRVSFHMPLRLYHAVLHHMHIMRAEQPGASIHVADALRDLITQSLALSHGERTIRKFLQETHAQTALPFSD